MIPKSLVLGALSLILAVIPACSLLHHGESPQQQFMSALQHGNGAQMNQIWLNMSPEDRADFTHSQGFKPVTTQDEIKTKLQRAIAEQTHDGGSAAPTFAAADGSEQQREIPTVNTSGGGLENLPNLSANSAPAQ